MSARILDLWLRTQRRKPTRAVEAAVAEPGKGLAALEGPGRDHARKGRREITLLDVGSWQAACAELGQDIDPQVRRANVYVEGIELRHTVGKTLRVGGCTVEILGETDPCHFMDEAAPGLRKALEPDLRGGVHGRIIDGGEIRVGDAVEVVDG